MDFLLDNATPILVASLSFSALLLCLPSRHSPVLAVKGRPKITVLVLGDIGRSPRMQYHTISIERRGGTVELVGYNDTEPRPELRNNKNITIHALPLPPPYLTTSSPLIFPITAPLKIFFQLYHLFATLLYVIPPEAGYILLQNPPSMPTFIVAWVVGRLRNMNVVIDWHNFGWTILGAKFGNSAPIVLLAMVYEKIFGRIGDANFTVTEEMKDVLRKDYGIKKPIHTLHDRPPTHFQPFTPSQRTAYLSTLSQTSSHLSSLANHSTRLIVSSTSWTPDEDFSILLDALVAYDRALSLTFFLSSSSTPTDQKEGQLPKLLVLITGKGPLQTHYLQQIESLEFQNITIHSLFLPAEDYPKLLACADLGVCLHTSSSGVDLPMKVVDLFGVGVPVVAVHFKAIGELVKDGVNGVTVKGGAEEMAEVLMRLLRPVHAGDKREKAGISELEKLKLGAMKETGERWEDNWDRVAGRVFGFGKEE